MHTAEYVDKLIIDLKNQGIPLTDVAWQAACACVSWPYLFGARGSKTIKNGVTVRQFDCRGFTYWILLQVYGWKLMGGGCTTQWNNDANWKAKGKVSDGIPKDTLVCLFYSKDNKEKTWEHTGFGYNGETCECSVGVQHFTKLNKKWTHWAIPACIDGSYIPTPAPTPDPKPEPTPEPGTAIVTGKNVALRYGPTKSAGIIVRVPTGSKMKKATPPDDWAYVEYNGKRGYMMKEFIKEG